MDTLSLQSARPLLALEMQQVLKAVSSMRDGVVAVLPRKCRDNWHNMVLAAVESTDNRWRDEDIYASPGKNAVACGTLHHDAQK
jgi:hypothetical protein